MRTINKVTYHIGPEQLTAADREAMQRVIAAAQRLPIRLAGRGHSHCDDTASDGGLLLVTTETNDQSGAAKS